MPSSFLPSGVNSAGGFRASRRRGSPGKAVPSGWRRSCHIRTRYRRASSDGVGLGDMEIYCASLGFFEVFFPLPWGSRLCQISRSPALPEIGFTSRPVRSGHRVSRLSGYCGVGKVQDTLHPERHFRQSGRIHIPVYHAGMVPVRLVRSDRRLHVHPVETHPQIFRIPDLGKRLMHPGILPVIPETLRLVHLYHTARSMRLMVPVAGIVPIHLQKPPYLIDHRFEV